MSEQSLGSAAALKNPIEIFLSGLEKACRTSKVYAHDPDAVPLQALYDSTFTAGVNAVTETTEIKVLVKPFEMVHERRIVYQNSERKGSLSFLLFQDGIRLVVLKQGITREEVIEVVKILATDFTQPEVMDEDLYCLFTEHGLPHFQVVGGDVGEEWKKADPVLEANLEKFILASQERNIEPEKTQKKNLRSEDLKVLDEFQLSPAQFSRSDEEMSKVIQTISKSLTHETRERETLERLLIMGFHFLMNGQNETGEVKMGQDLICKVVTMVLEGKHFSLFEAIIAKLNQLQTDLTNKQGDKRFLELRNLLFDLKYLNLFEPLVKNPETQEAASRVLVIGPPSACRLIIKLLAKNPTLVKTAGDFIFKNISSEMEWLVSEAEKNPEDENWDHLIQIFSSRPTQLLQKFLSALLKSKKPTIRLKVLKQLAFIGTVEAMAIFQEMFKSSQGNDRLSALECLSASKSKFALKVLHDYFGSPEFQSAPPQEKESAYICLMTIGGEAALPWIEKVWLTHEKKLFFKNSAEEERRMLILKALGRTQPAFIAPLLEKTPPELMTQELKDLARKISTSKGLQAKKKESGGGAS